MEKTEVASIREIVNKRIDALLKKAVQAVQTRKDDSIKYVQLAKKLSMRHRIAMGKTRKKMFCKSCECALKKDYNLQIETKDDWEIYICECGAKTKFHI